MYTFIHILCMLLRLQKHKNHKNIANTGILFFYLCTNEYFRLIYQYTILYT